MLDQMGAGYHPREPVIARDHAESDILRRSTPGKGLRRFLYNYLHCYTSTDIFQTVKLRRLKAPQMKPLEFLGSSRDDLAGMPADVRHDIRMIGEEP